MGKLSVDDTKRVAGLSKLHLTSNEMEKFTKQLSSVLEYIDQLGEVDTTHVEPTAQVTGLTNILRTDVIDVTKCLTQDEALSGTDNTKNGFFEVGAILKKNV